MRTSLNGKRRNPKKILRRRSSSGAELLLADAMESSTSSSGSAWYRFKKELGKRADSDIHLNSRRGSLPVEALTAGLGKTQTFEFKYEQFFTKYTCHAINSINLSKSWPSSKEENKGYSIKGNYLHISGILKNVKIKYAVIASLIKFFTNGCKTLN